MKKLHFHRQALFSTKKITVAEAYFVNRSAFNVLLNEWNKSKHWKYWEDFTDKVTNSLEQDIDYVESDNLTDPYFHFSKDNIVHFKSLNITSNRTPII